MFERFNEAARTVISRAKHEARETGAQRIAPIHLLLGVLGLDDPVITSLFKERAIPLPMARAHATAHGQAPAAPASADAMFDEDAYAILEGAIEAAQQEGNTFVGPEHLLLVLASGSRGAAAVPPVLSDLDVNADDLAREITEVVTKGEGRLGPTPTEPDAHHEHKVQLGAAGPEPTPAGGALDEFTEDLVEEARSGNLDPVIGREEAIDRMIRILVRRRKNNPVLVGAPGVGKTAIVEGLAQRIVTGTVPARLQNRHVRSLDLPRLVAGARYRGDFEERLKKVLHEATIGEVLLFIDEVHLIAGAGAGEGAMDAASILKPFLARGQVCLIGATTSEEYRRYLERDGALERRFQPIWIDEPTPDQTVDILKGMRDRFESHHDVAITNEAVTAAVELSARHLPERQLPDKAVDLLDEAAAAVQVNPEEARVAVEHVAHVVEESTGIPAGDLSHDDRARLQRLEHVMGHRVVGMPEAVSALARTIRRNRVGVSDHTRPMGSFIFAGPTGVGKTELTKTLAEALFGSDERLISLDMGEYGERHTAARLFGAPPGYVGYDEGGQFTEQVRRNPYSVVLLDEVEKAHPDIYNSLLQVLEEGRLSDGSGRTIEFTNTVIVMTTNLGTQSTTNEAVGFRSGTTGDDMDRMRADVQSALEDFFRPEFLNRVDETIIFPRLTRSDLRQVVDRMLEGLSRRVPQYTLAFTASAKTLLAEIGYDPVYGARPLRRVIQREIEDKISDAIIAGDLVEAGHLEIDVADDATSFSFTPSHTETPRP